MFPNVKLTEDLNKKYSDLRAENFKILGIELFPKKGQEPPTDAEAVALLRRRQAQVRPTIEANQQLIKFAPPKISGGFKPPVMPYKAKPSWLKNVLDGAVNLGATALTGAGADRSLNDSLPGEDRTTQAMLPAFVVEKQKTDNTKIFFYGIILIAVIFAAYKLIKNKK